MNVYVIILNKIDKETKPTVIKEHVNHLKQLDEQNRLVISGPFIDYPGGLVIIRASNKEEAVAIAEKDPFFVHGVRSFEVRTLEVANRDNNYLL